MKIFGVTENELRTLTIVNAAMAAFFSLGTGCFGYLLNLQAGAAMTEKVPEQTAAVLNIVQPGLMFLGIAFYVLGFLSWILRGNFIATIKRESDPQQRQYPVTRGKVGRVWDALWS